LPTLYNPKTFLSETFDKLDTSLAANRDLDSEVKYLSEPAPNIIEWVTGLNYGNVPATFGHVRQYQIMRDSFMLRCPVCNSMQPEAIDCWGKSRMYLESETLLVWNAEHQEFVCPKCGSTQYELMDDGMFSAYDEMIIIAGMRSGKSYLGAHIVGYFEHMLITWGMRGQGSIARMLSQEKAEWFECTCAASTAGQAQKTIYVKYREMRKNSPWISKYVSWVKAAEKAQVSGGVDKWKYKVTDDSIEDGWLRVRFNRVASDSSGVAGMTRILASIDEWARLVNSDGTRSAVELYRVMNQSLKTVRIAVSLNRLPPFLGMMTNVTSPVAQDDPAMLTYNMARDGELKHCYSWKGATWEYNPFMPRSEFDDEYIKDPVGAERDYGANPPLAATPYIDDPQRFWQCIDWSRRPLVQYSYDLKEDATGMKYIGASVEDCQVDPIHNYYVFIDAGRKWDAFSVVIARPEWVETHAVDEQGLSAEMDAHDIRGALLDAHEEPPKIPEGFIPIPKEDRLAVPGSMADLQRKHLDDEAKRAQLQRGRAGGANDQHFGAMMVTHIVSAFRIVPTVGREIWFESIVDIIRTLKQRLHIVDFGCDNWNSVSTLQAIRDMGIPTQEITLRIGDFMSFKNLAYNNRVSMLPPAESDHLELMSSGHLSLGVQQISMSGEGIALVELLKLSRSEDLNKVFNERKGSVRGQDSDDVARCIIGVHRLVQGSTTDPKAKNINKHQTLQRLRSMENPMSGQVFKSGRDF